MRSLLDAYRRWRHGRGYGVHSPWAYRLISEALRNHYAYYDDAAITDLFGRDAHVARQVYRVLALENCRVKAIIGNDTRWQKLADMASPQGKIDTLIIVGNVSDASLPYPADRIIIVSSNTTKWLKQIMAENTRCLAVDNGKSLAVANLSDATCKQIIEAKY